MKLSPAAASITVAVTIPSMKDSPFLQPKIQGCLYQHIGGGDGSGKRIINPRHM